MNTVTVMDVFARTARENPQGAALKARRDGQWQTWTWSDYHAQVRRVARGFMALGLQPREGVVILGFNRPEWFLADIAAIAAGAVPTGIYTTSSPEQMLYVAEHCEAGIAVVERAYLPAIEAIRAQLPRLRAVVLMDGEAPGTTSWAELSRLADTVPEADLDARIAAQKPGDLCTLIYTSGTTGNPKGVMLSHTNLVWTAEQLSQAFDIRATDRVISYLALSHVAEQVVTLHAPMARGATTYFAQSLEKLGDDLREVRPTIFFAVPRVWEKMQAKMQAAGAAAPPLRRKIAAWAKRQGLAAGYAEQGRGSRPFLHGLAKRLVFDTVRQRLGLDAARICATSAAPISRDTLEFFLSLGIPIVEVYGMSECTGPTTFSTPARYRTGAAGFAIPGTDLRIADGTGEICMRGPHVFLGYYKNEAATRETLDADGWLHSGDVGHLDAEGFLHVTDRIKELLVTSGGKNIAPGLLEAKLKSIPGIGQAVAIGDRRHYVSALLALDAERLPLAVTAAGSPARTPEEAARCAVFRAFLEKEVEKVNATLGRFESIRRFALLPDALTVETGELTPTLKLKRRVIAERRAAEIAALYDDASSERSA